MKNPIRPLLNYISASKAELQKVTWPTQKDVIRYSIMVVAVAVVMALFFAGIDFGLTKATDFILQKRGVTPAATQTQTQEIPVDNLKVNDVQVSTTPATK
ncbi:MAG: preprotein translocase subunit SecE [Patescibacteria group bacterium]